MEEVPAGTRREVRDDSLRFCGNSRHASLPWLDHLSRSFLDALVPGLTLGTCIATFAKYSGSHVNPAITVTFASSVSLKKRLVPPT
jgi:glycerol uptake facilitator-like aquaporin